MHRTAIITGAARNIGKGIAKRLLSEGWSCILIDIDHDALKAAHRELGGNERGCLEYAADISQPDTLERLFEWAKAQDFHVELLVNNAAYESPHSVLEITTDELTKSFATNLTGPFYLTKLFSNYWVKENIQGSVIFISSVHGKVIRTHPLYSASKAAIEMFVKEAAVELGEYGIRVNAVAPGATQDTEELKEDFRTPLGYYEQPQDIAEMVAFIASSKARFITGQTLVVDGGYSLTHTHHWLKKGKLAK